jgi:futalosine hydrolase
LDELTNHPATVSPELPNLILIPTEIERRPIEASLRFDSSRWSIHTVGFGVVAAAIETANAIARQRPSRVILAGIAGLFTRHQSDSVHVGDAIWFDYIGMDGIGIGQGDQFVGAMDLGWDWFQADKEPAMIRCEIPVGTDPAMLLTVCSGSADPADADRRAERYPAAIGEDMESFSVALSCRSAGIPISVVRGFSNLVGRRDKSEWRVDQALENVTSRLQQVIDENTP